MQEKDLFEEFEFKPITEGLGFHKKKEKVQTSTKSLALNTDTKTKSLPISENTILTPTTTESLVNKAETHKTQGDVKIKPSVFDTSYSPNPTPPPGNVSAHSVLQDLQNKRSHLNFKESTPYPRRTESLWIDSYPELSAMILDSLLVMAGVLSVLISTLLVTKIDLLGLLKQSLLSEMLLLGYALLTVVSLSYLFIFRYFLGRTPGEWTTDQKLIITQSTFSKGIIYFWRALLTTLTGFVTLPLIGYLSHSDLLGRLSGTRLKKEHLS